MLEIQSFKSSYKVFFSREPFSGIDHLLTPKTHFIVDERVASLYQDQLKEVLKFKSVLKIKAEENNKSIDRIEAYTNHLIENGIQKDHLLVAIGGGILQDITCFLASVLFRGMGWIFYPTTLLAQADSCIGSKSSLNVGSVKNLIGTFHPPTEVRISNALLQTLDPKDVLSGIGEMIKVHIIDSDASFNEIHLNYGKLLTEEKVMEYFIRRSLEIKKKYIELDEFDRDIRNIFNYGHSFGHAIEAATHFEIPHGIAVTIGMDMANFTALKINRLSTQKYKKIHPLLVKNFSAFQKVKIPLDPFLEAISKDKKNINKMLTLILPKEEGSVEKVSVKNDENFRKICADYFDQFGYFENKCLN